MISCPRCGNKIHIRISTRWTNGIRNIKCENCKSELEQTYETKFINSIILAIFIVGVYSIFVNTINKFLIAITSNIFIQVIIVTILGGCLGGIISRLSFPWDKYE